VQAVERVKQVRFFRAQQLAVLCRDPDRADGCVVHAHFTRRDARSAKRRHHDVAAARSRDHQSELVERCEMVQRLDCEGSPSAFTLVDRRADLGHVAGGALEPCLSGIVEPGVDTLVREERGQPDPEYGDGAEGDCEPRAQADPAHRPGAFASRYPDPTTVRT
jgi:hypothetical protein